jgi:hypothetical protein
MGIVTGFVLSFAKALVWSGGSFNGETFGYAFAAILVPMAVAYAVAGREKARNPSLFSLTFCVLCFVLYLMEWSEHLRSTKHTRDVIRQAAGLKAGLGDESSGAPQTDAILRDSLRDMMDRRKLHDAAVAKFAPDLELLYSAESFSSSVAIHRTLDAVRGTLSVDQEFTGQLDEWQKGVEAHVNRSSMSESEKQDYMRGFRKSLGGSKILSVRQQIVETETQWADSTSDLYNFALSNAAKIAIKGSEIIIADENIKQEFNRKLTNSQAIRKDLHSLNSQIRQLQREGMQQFGVTPEDLGLKGDNQRTAN